jgi:hypothetical protein
MLEKKVLDGIEHWFVPYGVIESSYSYNTDAYRAMMMNRNHQSWNARQGIIFRASW